MKEKWMVIQSLLVLTKDLIARQLHGNASPVAAYH